MSQSRKNSQFGESLALSLANWNRSLGAECFQPYRFRLVKHLRYIQMSYTCTKIFAKITQNARKLNVSGVVLNATSKSLLKHCKTPKRSPDVEIMMSQTPIKIVLKQIKKKYFHIDSILPTKKKRISNFKFIYAQ